MRLTLIIPILLLSSVNSFAQDKFDWSLSFGGESSDFMQTIRVHEGDIYVYGNVGAYPDTLFIGSYPITVSGTQLIKLDSNRNVIWNKSIPGGIHQNAKALAVDPEGNPFVTYYGGGGATIKKYDPNGNSIWTKTIYADPTFGFGSLQPRSIECDNLGNVFIGGDFQAEVLLFDNDTVFRIENTTYQSNDFIAKYNMNGNVEWAKNLGALKNSVCDFQLTCDQNNAVLVTTGMKNDTLIFAGDTIVNSYSGVYQMLLAKFDDQGNEVWAKTGKAAAPGSGSYGTSVTSDFNNNIYVGGTFEGLTTLSNQWSWGGDAFLVKYDELGNFIWAETFGGSGSDDCKSVAVDSDENVFLTGFYPGPTLNLGDTTITNSSWNSSNIYLVKFDSLGNRKWVECFGGEFTDQPRHMTIDNNDNLYLTGFFQSDSIIVANDILINLGDHSREVFIIKMNPSNSTIVNVNEIGKTDYTLFPNPIEDDLNFVLGANVSNGVVTIIDSKGNVVSEENRISGGNFKIRTSTLQKGAYLVVLTEQGKVILREKIVKLN